MVTKWQRPSSLERKKIGCHVWGWAAGWTWVRGGERNQGASCQEIWHQGRGWCLKLTQPSDGNDKRPDSPLKLPLHSCADTVHLTLLLSSSIFDLISFLLLELENTLHDVWHLICVQALVYHHHLFLPIHRLVLHCTLFILFSVCIQFMSFDSVTSSYPHTAEHANLNSKEKKRKTLTCHFQRRIATDCLAQVVARHTHVDTFVRFASPAVDNSQEEEGATGQEHPVGSRVLSIGLDAFAVFVPFHHWSRPSFGLTVEGGWLTLGHDQIRRMFYDPRRSIL